jgi:hypothetical protein
MKKALKTLSIVLCVILAFSALTISAGAKSNKKYVKSIKVTKRATIIIPAKSSYSKRAFKVTVKTKGKASKKFTAKSGNNSVASVKVSGKKIIVTAKKAGSAKITLKTKGKSKKKKKLTAKLLVTVKKNKAVSSPKPYNPNYVPPKPGTSTPSNPSKPSNPSNPSTPSNPSNPSTPSNPSNPSNPGGNLSSSYNQLKNYIINYGTEDSDGDYYITDSYSNNYDVYFYCKIYYIVDSDSFLFMTCNSEDNYDDYDDYEGYCDYWTTMTLDNGGSRSTVAAWSGDIFTYDYYDDEHYENYDQDFRATATLYPSTFDDDTELDFSLDYGYATESLIDKWGNSDLQDSMVAWQYMLYDMDLNFYDLGFYNY